MPFHSCAHGVLCHVMCYVSMVCTIASKCSHVFTIEILIILGGKAQVWKENNLSPPIIPGTIVFFPCFDFTI